MTTGLGPLLFTLLLQSQSQPASDAIREARERLAAGEASAAESSARRALELSSSFVPEREIESRPDRGLLFEDMILDARRSYRERRASYLRVLGDALAAQERWREARKAYGQAEALDPSPELLLRMADHPDLELRAKIDLLLGAFLHEGADRPALEARLLDTGAFRSRNALEASLDRRRFPVLAERFSGLELLPDALPPFQGVTDEGTFSTESLFRAGTVLVLYLPEPTCPRCSEELDGLVRPVLEAERRGEEVEVVALVPESDLEIARRIVRLLGMSVGVGQRRTLPATLEISEQGEMRVAARSGLTQLLVVLGRDRTASDIRQRLDAVFEHLRSSLVIDDVEPEEASASLVRLERGVNEQRTLLAWIEALDRLEAGPAPLQDLYARLDRQTQRVVRSGDRSLGRELVAALSRLEGANGAKSRALALLEPRIGESLLEEARRLDPSVRRTAPGEQGVFRLAIEDDLLALQRSFSAEGGLRHFAFGLALRDDGLEHLWTLPMEEKPDGVAILASGVAVRFVREGENPCAGLRLVRGGEVAYEGCPAIVLDGEVVEVAPALVDDVPGGPVLYRRGVVGGDGAGALPRGLELFRSGDFAGAETAFAEAMEEVDPVAPYGSSDLRYNRARSLEEQGKRLEALAIYRSLGDVTYQDAVDERARAIEAGR